MKAFYDEKINQIRKDVESQTRQDMQSSSQSNLVSTLQNSQTGDILQKLMNQDQFKDTIEQLNQAVGQKETLETKLKRIKAKIEKAKMIKF